jgi:membrane protein
LGESREPSRLTGVREAAASRLERVESAALARGRTRPLAVMARRIGKHELIDRGAALTYYGVLALIPGLLVLFSVIGLFGNQQTVDSVLEIFDEVGPSDGERVARDPLTSLLQDDTRSGVLLGTGLLGVLWTASAYCGCFFRASATIWGVERRPMWRAWPLRMALTVAILILIALALLLIAVTGQLAQSLGDELGVGDAVLDVYGFAKWPALLVVVTFAVGILYRASPSGERTATDWRVLTPGGAVAVVAWMLVSIGFEVYANSIATWESTYGALGTTIAGLIWLWLTNLTLLMGVELDAALERRVQEATESSEPAGAGPAAGSATVQKT